MKHSIKEELKMRMPEGKMMIKKKVVEKHKKEMMEELKSKFKK